MIVRQKKLQQTVPKPTDAVVEDEVHAFDAGGRLRYRGAPDSDHGDESQNAAWLRGALDALLDGADPAPAETKPVGCSIKWK